MLKRLWQKSLGVHLSRTRQMTPPKTRSPEPRQVGNHDEWFSTAGEYFLPARQPRRLPALWLQAKLTISLTSIQDKFAKLFMTIAAELWLRGRIETLEAVFQAAARNFTISEIFVLANATC